MAKPARRGSFFSVFLAAVALIGAALAPVAEVRAQSLYNLPKYAAIVVDATTGEVLYARRADEPRFPASITKVMTLYLVFEALATGRLAPTDQVVLSPHAANQAPSKSGLRAGESITVDQALRITAVKSANDLAVALAEKVGGTEPRFAALMTLRAQELGMTNTRFVNANGLPDSRQITTARDIAILSRAVMRDYPQYYSYFSLHSTDFHGQHITNHNRLLQKMPGVDGLKTGFTNAAGFNLAASAVRDGRRLITVVMGGSSTAARDENVEDLLNAGFDVLAKRKLGQTITIAANMREPDEASGPVLRPATEQGSGDQSGLQVAVVDNPLLRGVQAQGDEDAAEAPASLKDATLALSNSDREGGSDCSKVVEKVKLKARRHHRAHTVTRTRTVCHAASPAGAATHVVATADTPDCGKAIHGRSRKARAARKAAASACKSEQQVAAASPAKGAPAAAAQPPAQTAQNAQAAGLKGRTDSDAAGAYRIQVGAFDSKREAERHLTRISERYGAVVASASSQVQPAKRGAYRARFAGFSAQGAKAACATLTAKGERCMVVAPS